jgi:hypothetical protein
MLPNKFLIYDNEILLGRVEYHKHLLPDNFDMSLIYGGGRFILNYEDRTISLYGESFDFGKFDRELVFQCNLPDKLKDFKIILLDL